MSSSDALHRWDMEIVFPGFDSEEYRSERDSLLRSLSELESRFDQAGIDKGGSADPSVIDGVLSEVNLFLERLSTLSSYVSCVVSTDTRDERALATRSELDPALARVRKLLKRLTGWLGGLDVEEAVKVSEEARAHRFPIEKARKSAEHLMSPELESLTSDMEITGSSAWAKLYRQVSSQLMVPIEIDGEKRELPISEIRALASVPERSTRKVAYESELAAWKKVEVPLAASLNGIKGETILLDGRRGWASPLERVCFSANMDLGTLEAMMTAARESFPMFRRYLRAKAKALGLDVLAFYDLFAPLGKDTKNWSHREAEEFVASQFANYSPKLSEYARRAFRERWIDWDPRLGKVDGAYCASLRKDQSRILMNFKGTYGWVSTLAHELGHGYHNLCLYGRTPLQKETPMTLAETASIFCETIVKNAVIETGTDDEKLVALEGALQGACQVVVDISSRYLFEKSVFELRAKREGSPREFCELMLQAQRDTYGDGLDGEVLHPYMWAAKGHYYGPTFYNFPYMFGLLFGLGLYSVYRQEGESFKARYDDLLSSTGLADAATLAARFGIDIRTPEFWRGSLAQIGTDVERFEELIGC